MWIFASRTIIIIVVDTYCHCEGIWLNSSPSRRPSQHHFSLSLSLPQWLVDLLSWTMSGGISSLYENIASCFVPLKSTKWLFYVHFISTVNRFIGFTHLKMILSSDCIQLYSATSEITNQIVLYIEWALQHCKSDKFLVAYDRKNQGKNQFSHWWWN